MAQLEAKRLIIASRIKEARKISGLSQAQVANLLGLHRPSISEAEAGNRKVSAEEISQLSEIYKVSSAWLLGEGSEKLDINKDKVQIAARELQKLKSEDLDKLLKLLAIICEPGELN